MVLSSYIADVVWVNCVRALWPSPLQVGLLHGRAQETTTALSLLGLICAAQVSALAELPELQDLDTLWPRSPAVNLFLHDTNSNQDLIILDSS